MLLTRAVVCFVTKHFSFWLGWAAMSVAFKRRHETQQLIVIRRLCDTSWQHGTSFTLLLTQLETKVSALVTLTWDAEILLIPKLQEWLREWQWQEKLLQVRTLCLTGFYQANFAARNVLVETSHRSSLRWLRLFMLSYVDWNYSPFFEEPEFLLVSTFETNSRLNRDLLV